VQKQSEGCSGIAKSKETIMQSRNRRFLLVGALAAMAQLTLAATAQLNPAAASAAQSEPVPGIIAAQLHRQGVACTTPRGAALDSENSIAHETVWVLRCDEASYRVTLIPHLRARIAPVCRQDQTENSTDAGGIAGKRSLGHDPIPPRTKFVNSTEAR
jgi:hypothetical protein